MVWFLSETLITQSYIITDMGAAYNQENTPYAKSLILKMNLTDNMDSLASNLHNAVKNT